jgi:hypothetical protein
VEILCRSVAMRDGEVPAGEPILMAGAIIGRPIC